MASLKRDFPDLFQEAMKSIWEACITRHQLVFSLLLGTTIVSVGCGRVLETAPSSPTVSVPVVASPVLYLTPTPSVLTGGVSTTVVETLPPPSLTGAKAFTQVPVSDLSDVAWDYLITLTNHHSPRESATDQELRAAAYLIGEFRAMGLEAVLQEFSVQILSSGSPVFVVTGPEYSEIKGFPMGLSGHGQASGRLVDVGKAIERDRPLEDLTGKIALVERGQITFEEKVNYLAKAGAVAAVIYNNRSGGFGGTLTSQGPIPVISIGKESGVKIRNQIARGVVTATVSVILETMESRNVVAQKQGVLDDRRVVVLGGHYDTVSNVPGANDNGSGIATILTIAREVSKKSYPFTLRFVAFGSEELGLLGSKYYVEGLTDEERDSIVAMLNFDALGTGEVVGVLGSLELINNIAEIGSYRSVGVERRFKMVGGSDHMPFAEAGIPAVFFHADDFSRIHTPEDKLEFVSRRLMGVSAVLAIHLLDELAES